MRKFLLNGIWTASNSTLTIASPWPGIECDPVFQASPEQARNAAQAAQKAFAETHAVPRFKRAEALRFISAGIAARAEEFSRSIRDEAGKPMGLARVEVRRAVGVFAVASEEASRPPGETVHPDREAHGPGLSARLEYFPLGPVLGISPFNFPLNLIAHKVAPALAAGCSIVVKPPPQAPGAALLLAEIVLDSGLPSAALQVLPGGLETGAALCACPEFAAVSFTGSAQAGWSIKQKALPHQKVLLELGGNAALIVDESADLDAAATAVSMGGYAYSGQVCISTQRVFAHSGVADEFERKLAEKILREVKVSADPHADDALAGPLIDKRSADRIENWVQSAIAAGAKVLVRGERKSEKLISPWLLGEVPPDQPLSCEEVFGPVVILETVADFNTGLARANASKYGLQTSVFTQSLRNAERAYRELECGSVLVNLPTSFRLDSALYGGIKESGFGREGVAAVIREFSEPKLLVVKS